MPGEMDRITVLAGNAIHALPALLAVTPVYLLGVAMAWCLGVRGRALPLISAMPLLIGGAALMGRPSHSSGCRRLRFGCSRV